LAPEVAVAAVAATQVLRSARLAVRVEGQVELRPQAGVAAAVQEPAERRQRAVRADPAAAALDHPARLAA
jgi:hypothetical protein